MKYEDEILALIQKEKLPSEGERGLAVYLDDDLSQTVHSMAVVSALMQAYIKKNASVAQPQEAYALETERIENRYNAAFEHYTALETKKADAKK